MCTYTYIKCTCVLSAFVVDVLLPLLHVRAPERYVYACDLVGGCTS